ncbi:MAG: DUF4325 domain-containing protein [bacterium]|nr:DUF4325 domain-containing protein [bacterium]
MLNKKQHIFDILKKNGRIDSQEIARSLGVSRVYASKLISELVHEGQVFQIGKTKGSFYVLTSERSHFFDMQFHKTFNNTALKEDEVYGKIQHLIHDYLKKNVESILSYAFTEMLNNAIEHSRSSKVTVDFTANRAEISFEITDRGIGIFNNLRKKFQLKDNYEALQRVLKGKQTTSPKYHSGQGIFFTSKIADRFEIMSSKLHLIFDNTIPDVFVDEIKPVKGTRVIFRMRKSSDKELKSVFDQYTNDDFRFSKTQTIVELYKQEDSYVSRSQAKKLLEGLEGFDTIILDFKKIQLVGQGFADEVFRVYQTRRPTVELIPIHMDSPVEFMIQRAIAQYQEEKRGVVE